jgi:hypothetical protein
MAPSKNGHSRQISVHRDCVALVHPNRSERIVGTKFKRDLRCAGGTTGRVVKNSVGWMRRITRNAPIGESFTIIKVDVLRACESA